MTRASCRGHWTDNKGNPLMWDDLDVAAQLDICHTCPVRATCLADAERLAATGLRPIDIVQGGRYWRGYVKGTSRPRQKCRRGHPMTGDNVHIDARGRRNCVTCQRLREAHAAGRPLPPFDDTRDTCPHGHPWTRSTVRLEKTGHGDRRCWRCMECRRASARAQKTGHTLTQQLAAEATA
jgi:hypothetical protein